MNTTPVTRVHTESGSHIEPPLNPGWDPLSQLRWHGAVVTLDVGLPVTVSQDPDDPDMYSLTVGYTGCSPMTYDSVWTYLNGVAVGALEAVSATEAGSGSREMSDTDTMPIRRRSAPEVDPASPTGGDA